MKYACGHTLLELMIALTLSALIFLMIDKLVVNLWLTRSSLESAQDQLRTRELPSQLFAELVFHAGGLGCRALREGLEIKTSYPIQEGFFIHKGSALSLINNELWVHDTRSHRLVLWEGFVAGAQLKVPELRKISDWILISDCQGAELVPEGGRLIQDYQPPVYLVPLTLVRWFFEADALKREQRYPKQNTQTIAESIEQGNWRVESGYLVLDWVIKGESAAFVFELGNSPCC